MDSVNDFEMNENGINEIRMNLGLSYLLPLLFVARSFTPMRSVSCKSLKRPTCKGEKNVKETEDRIFKLAMRALSQMSRKLRLKEVYICHA